MKILPKEKLFKRSATNYQKKRDEVNSNFHRNYFFTLVAAALPAASKRVDAGEIPVVIGTWL